MSTRSFSAAVKDQLANTQIKKKCCRRAFSDGCGIFSGPESPGKLIRRGASGLVCGECVQHFIAGIFCAAGSVSDPEKSYHLDFSFNDEDAADAAFEVLLSAGFGAGKVVRKGRYVLYFKDSSKIEDILGYIGAANGAFDVMNAKIMREIRENTNRQVNCDSANIAKTLSAAEEHIRMIKYLYECGGINSLTGDLKKTAEFRIEFPDDSLFELGQRFVPPVSKSGVKHRLDKIADAYMSAFESNKQKSQ